VLSGLSARSEDRGHRYVEAASYFVPLDLVSHSVTDRGERLGRLRAEDGGRAHAAVRDA
jgi:hypothetical protein